MQGTGAIKKSFIHNKKRYGSGAKSGFQHCIYVHKKKESDLKSCLIFMICFQELLVKSAGLLKKKKLKVLLKMLSLNLLSHAVMQRCLAQSQLHDVVVFSEVRNAGFFYLQHQQGLLFNI